MAWKKSEGDADISMEIDSLSDDEHVIFVSSSYWMMIY
jgi:hypothetical protein